MRADRRGTVTLAVVLIAGLATSGASVAERNADIDAPGATEVTDQRLRDWLGAILERLHRQGGGSGSAPVFHVLSWDAVNAFVTPEGVVYLTTALLSQVESDDELACILSHEMAHFQLGHHEGRQKLGTLWKALGLLALATPGASAMVSGQALGMLTELRYSRAHELAADRAALEVCVGAGYFPAGLLQFLTRQQGESGALNDAVSGWISTHPTNPDRIRQVRAFLEERGIDPDHRPTVGLSFRNHGIFLHVDPSLAPAGVPPREEGRRPLWVLAAGESPGPPGVPTGFVEEPRGALRAEGASLTLRVLTGKPVLLGSQRLSIDMPPPMELAASYRVSGPCLVTLALACYDGPGRYLDRYTLEARHAAAAAAEQRLEMGVEGNPNSIPRGTRHVEVEVMLHGPRGTRMIIERLQLLPILEAPMFSRPAVVESQVPNAGFEEDGGPGGSPRGWSTERGGARVDTEMRQSGRQSLRCHADTPKETVVLVSERFPLDPATDYLLSGYLKSYNGKQRMSLGVRFYDEAGTPISTAFVAAEGIFPPDRFTKYHGVLTAIGGKYPIPPEARQAAVVGESGYYSTDPGWFDDIALVPVQSSSAGLEELRPRPRPADRPGSREELEKMKQDF